jgi:hypothetical protein
MSESRELFLQNRFAMAAVLLHRCYTLLGRDKGFASAALVIECEDFFEETRDMLIAELEEKPIPVVKEPEEAPWQAPKAPEPNTSWRTNLIAQMNKDRL